MAHGPARRVPPGAAPWRGVGRHARRPDPPIIRLNARLPDGLARAADRWAQPTGLVWLTLVMLDANWRQRRHFDVWFSWADQGRYLASARAWAAGLLDPALHHYPAGYSLMAAPFVAVCPAQPFAVPDMICLAASLLIFVRIAQRLVPQTPGWRSLAVFAFCLGTTGTPALRSIWAVPWNTTGAAPWQLGAILATLWLAERPSAARASLAGVLLGLLLGTRPTDALVLAPCCGAFAAFVLWRAGRLTLRQEESRAGLRPKGSWAWLRHDGPWAWLRLAAACTAGATAGVLPALLAHLAVHGATGGAYFAKSATIGFEWRLIPLHWVLLVLDPRPLLPGDIGMAEAMPWIAPGFAGLLLLVRRGAPAPAWRLVAAAVGLHWLLYLSYRDLHTYALWHFFGVHYFKWSFPFLALAALRLGALLARPGQRRAAWLALAAGAGLVLWQPVPILGAAVPVAVSQTHRTAPLPMPLSPVDDAIYLPMTGGWWQILAGPASLQAGGTAPELTNTRDFKLMPTAGGALLQPLRVLPPGPYVFTPAPDTALVPGRDIVAVRISLRPGLPCGVWPHRAACLPAAKPNRG